MSMSFLVHARADRIQLIDQPVEAFKILIVTGPSPDASPEKNKALYITVPIPGETSKLIAGLRDLANKLEAQTFDEE